MCILATPGAVISCSSQALVKDPCVIALWYVGIIIMDISQCHKDFRKRCHVKVAIRIIAGLATSYNHWFKPLK